jgi:RNA polymerase sigma-70 factor (ECF subfamily)
MWRISRFRADDGSGRGSWRTANAAAGALAGARAVALNARVTDATLSQSAAFIGAIEAVAKRRDRTAFAELFGYFAPRVKAYLMRLGSDAASAEDLMQDVMLTVWRRAESYDAAQAGVGTWIFTIARNRRIDALRRERRPALDAEDPALRPEPPASADQVTAAQQWEERLGAALRELPPEQSEMVRLAYYEDRSHSDIAQRLNIPLGTVKSRLRLAVARLRSRFEEK